MGSPRGGEEDEEGARVSDGARDSAHVRSQPNCYCGQQCLCICCVRVVSVCNMASPTEAKKRKVLIAVDMSHWAEGAFDCEHKRRLRW